MKFPWDLFFCVLPIVSAAHYVSIELWELLMEWGKFLPKYVIPVSVLVITGIGLIAVSWHLHKSRYGFHFSRVGALGAIILAQFFGMGFHHLLPSSSWISFVSFLILVITLPIAHHLSHATEIFISLDDPVLAKDYCKERGLLNALIIPVSKPNLLPTLNSNGKWTLQGQINNIEISPIEFTGNIGEDITLLNSLGGPTWNWQQLLRGLEPHVIDKHHAIQDIRLLGTAIDYVKIVKKFLSQYVEASSLKVEGEVSFENFNQLMAAFRSIIQRLQGEVREAKIAVDVTGGFKIASIAGAILTLNRACVVQYVQSKDSVDLSRAKDNTMNAYIYDLRRPVPFAPQP